MNSLKKYKIEQNMVNSSKLVIEPHVDLEASL